MFVFWSILPFPPPHTHPTPHLPFFVRLFWMESFIQLTLALVYVIFFTFFPPFLFFDTSPTPFSAFFLFPSFLITSLPNSCKMLPPFFLPDSFFPSRSSSSPIFFSHFHNVYPKIDSPSPPFVIPELLGGPSQKFFPPPYSFLLTSTSPSHPVAHSLTPVFSVQLPPSLHPLSSPSFFCFSEIWPFFFDVHSVLRGTLATLLIIFSYQD